MLYTISATKPLNRNADVVSTFNGFEDAVFFPITFYNPSNSRSRHNRLIPTPWSRPVLFCHYTVNCVLQHSSYYCILSDKETVEEPCHTGLYINIEQCRVRPCFPRNQGTSIGISKVICIDRAARLHSCLIQRQSLI